MKRATPATQPATSDEAALDALLALALAHPALAAERGIVIVTEPLAARLQRPAPGAPWEVVSVFRS